LTAFQKILGLTLSPELLEIEGSNGKDFCSAVLYPECSFLMIPMDTLKFCLEEHTILVLKCAVRVGGCSSCALGGYAQPKKSKIKNNNPKYSGR
jgi:hypothetical protein